MPVCTSLTARESDSEVSGQDCLSRELPGGSALSSCILPTPMLTPPPHPCKSSPHSFFPLDKLCKAPFPFLFFYQLEGSGFGKCSGISFRLMPIGLYRKNRGGNKNPPNSPTPSWEGKTESCPSTVEGIQKQFEELASGPGALQGPWKLLTGPRHKQLKGCLSISTGQHIFLLFLSPREGRPLGSLPSLSWAGLHGTWGLWGQDLYRETLISLHRGGVGGGIFQAGLTLTPKAEEIRDETRE